MLTAGEAPETQRSPQTTPPRELLTPGWGEQVATRQAQLQPGGFAESAMPPPQGFGAPQLEKRKLGLLTYVHGANALTQPVGR